MTQFRQGDVWVETDSIPDGAVAATRDDRGRIVLALGEQTGHAHAILEPEVEQFTVADQVDRWLRVRGGGATIVHEEHGPIALPPGEFRVQIQREYSPAEIRQVLD